MPELRTIFLAAGFALAGTCIAHAGCAEDFAALTGSRADLGSYEMHMSMSFTTKGQMGHSEFILTVTAPDTIDFKRKSDTAGAFGGGNDDMRIYKGRLSVFNGAAWKAIPDGHPEELMDKIRGAPFLGISNSTDVKCLGTVTRDGATYIAFSHQIPGRTPIDTVTYFDSKTRLPHDSVGHSAVVFKEDNSVGTSDMVASFRFDPTIRIEPPH